MQRAFFGMAFVLLSGSVSAAETEDALATVTDLGRANGLALACGEKEVVSLAKSLMLLHAPKTPRYGEAFEQATQQAFLGQVKGAEACPAASVLTAQLESIGRRLREALPAERK